MDLNQLIKEAEERGYSKKEITEMLLKKGYSQLEIQQAFGFKKSQVKTIQKQYSYTEKIKMLFTNPTNYFELIREDSILNSLILFSISLLVMNLISLGLYYLFSSFFGYIGYNQTLLSFLLPLGLAFIISSIIIGILITFIFSLVTHLTAKLFGGEGRYIDSYNISTYSSIPSVIFSIIPIVGFLAVIYSIVLMVFGISYAYNLTKSKSVVAVLMPLIIALVLIVVFIGWLVSSYLY